MVGPATLLASANDSIARASSPGYGHPPTGCAGGAVESGNSDSGDGDSEHEQHDGDNDHPRPG